MGGEARDDVWKRMWEMTFNFSISSLLTTADIDHEEALRRLIEANDKVIKLELSGGEADSGKGFEEATLVVK